MYHADKKKRKVENGHIKKDSVLSKVDKTKLQLLGNIERGHKQTKKKEKII